MKSLPLYLFLIFMLAAGCNNSGKEKQTTSEEVASISKPIGYETHGEGDTTLVFIHGWNIDKSYWRSQINHFSKTYKVLAMDLINQKNSQDSLRKWTIDEFADDIIDVVSKEKLNNLVLIGHSMSGEICLGINQKIPEKVIAIIGIDNFREVDFDLSQYDMKEINAFVDEMSNNYSVRAAVMAEGLFPKENRNEQVFQRVRGDFQSADSIIATSIFRNLYTAWDNTKNILPSLSHPLRVVMCDFLPYNETGLQKYAVNGYKIIGISNSGHYPMIEQPEDFNNALEAFLNDIKAGDKE